MEMQITFLYDLTENEIDGAIIHYDTTAEEIQEIIQRVKDRLPSEWTIDDIQEALPTDCTVFMKYNCQEVTY